MLEYLKKHGNAPLNGATWNDADRLIFAQTAYLNFSAETPRGATLSEALEMVSFAADEGASETRFGFQHRDDRTLRGLLAVSGRFAQVRFLDFTRALMPDGQFAALALMLPGERLLIAFRGTDNTLAGWKEDFDLAYKREIPAQRMACEYVEKFACMAGCLELIGHSKGGNLALYAAANGSTEVQKRLTLAVSFDGPGLAPHVIDSDGYRRVQKRLRLCIPRASLVGLLFQQPENVRMVESRTFSILQHYPYTWRTEGMDLVDAGRQSIPGEKLGLAVRGLLDKLTPGTREQFVEAVYEIVAATGAETLNDLVRGWISNTPAVTKKLLSTDKETYRLLLKILIAFWLSVAEALGVPVHSDRLENF